MNEFKVRTPFFPTYDQVRAIIPVFVGRRKSDITHFIRTIHDQTGTPQNPVDWTNPDEWIGQRLKGENAEFAQRIWEDTDHLVNPRHIYGSYLYINGFEILTVDDEGNYQLTDRGKGFIGEDEQVIRELDDAEGLIQLLSILSTKSRAKRGDLLPEWSEYLQEWSKFTTVATHNDTLRRRLLNLVQRKLVDREGNNYSINDAGLAWLEKAGPIETDPKRELLKAVKQFNLDQRAALKKELSNLHPYKFEQLIRDLLEAMGYEDVIVTKEAGDKGVDVIGTIQFGITTVREVVQVKRTPKSSIGRPILDQLRGALPYHQAIRGTIITLGTVSKGAREAAIFPGAAPITMIDGEKLIDLMVEHEVGIKKRPVVMWEIDPNAFEEPAEELDVPESE